MLGVILYYRPKILLCNELQCVIMAKGVSPKQEPDCGMRPRHNLRRKIPWCPQHGKSTNCSLLSSAALSVSGCWHSPAARLQLVSPLPLHHLRQTTSSKCGEMDTAWQSEDSDTVEWIQSVDGRHHHRQFRVHGCTRNGPGQAGHGHRRFQSGSVSEEVGRTGLPTRLTCPIQTRFQKAHSCHFEG